MYLLYFYRGILKIKHGKMVIGSFVADDDCRHTMIPKEPLTVEHGKIWCENYTDLLLAIYTLLAHREKYVKKMQDKWSKDFGFEEDKMAAKKNEETLIMHEDGTVTKLGLFNDAFTEAELRYLKDRIRKDIILIESKKNDSSFGKGYKDMCAAEKVRWDRDLEMCYEIFDKLLMMGIREDI